MADGSSDDDVIHLASFNTHRSRGTNTLGFILALLSSLLEVLVVWVSLNFLCVILLAKRVRAKTSYITISSSSDSEDEPVRFIPNVPVVVKDDEEEEDVHS